MTFQESLERDLDVFINPSEFGEIVTINGAEIRVVKTYTLAELGGEKSSNLKGTKPALHGQNLIGNSLVLYFEAGEFLAALGAIPKHTEFIKISGRRYRVDEVQTLAGLTRLKCSADSMNVPRPKLEAL